MSLELQPIPLRCEQVLAARNFVARCMELHRCERALHALQGCFPGFDTESTLLKVLTLRALDSTQAFAVAKFAMHAQSVMTRVDRATVGPEFVDALAAGPDADTSWAPSRSLGFSSRFAHFFVDLERFPAIDAWSEQALAAHFVRSPEVPGVSKYVRFAHDVSRLAEQVGVTRRDLGRYLWLAGQHRAWARSSRAVIQRQVRALFESAPTTVGLLFGIAAQGGARVRSAGATKRAAVAATVKA